MEPGYPRQCYMGLPPVPGMPPLPKGAYPVDYSDLRNLSGTTLLSPPHNPSSNRDPIPKPEPRANILMASFNLAGPNNENMNANIRDKIFEIAGFMGVSMKEEFREEYDRWEMINEMQELAIVRE